MEVSTDSTAGPGVADRLVDLSGTAHDLSSSSVVHQAHALLAQEFGEDYVTMDELDGRIGGCDDGTVVAWMCDNRLRAVGVARAADADEIEAIAGMTDVRTNKRIGCIETLAVEPGARHRGIGKAMASELVARLHAGGYSTILMATWISGTADNAEHIARALGFERLGEIEHYWQHDSIERGWSCTVCGNPCVCSVGIWLLRERQTADRVSEPPLS